jgi:hypothetical protein
MSSVRGVRQIPCFLVYVKSGGVCLNEGGMEGQGKTDASKVVACVSELQACRSSRVAIEPTRIAILSSGTRRSLPPVLPRLHNPWLKPKPLSVHVEVPGSDHVLALEMQWNGARRALFCFPMYERRSTAWAMVERRSFGCHGLSPGRP